MENIKKDFMEKDNCPRIEGQFVVCLSSGYNFLAESVWYMKTQSRDHFRFSVPAGGEKRVEPDRIEQILKISGI